MSNIGDVDAQSAIQDLPQRGATVNKFSDETRSEPGNFKVRGVEKVKVVRRYRGNNSTKGKNKPSESQERLVRVLLKT